MAMNTVNQVLEEARTLSESEARVLLDFIGYLKYRRARAGAPAQDIRAGKYSRGECQERS